ncbi:MAG: hypothetical protein KAI29_01430 [Cyclobacteriaceae bacterium]|nr:hypothetical protein [Cyclobacteriaceae bacterium]
MTNIILKKNGIKKFITPRKKLVMKDERLKIEVRRPETGDGRRPGLQTLELFST